MIVISSQLLEMEHGRNADLHIQRFISYLMVQRNSYRYARKIELL